MPNKIAIRTKHKNMQNLYNKIINYMRLEVNLDVSTVQNQTITPKHKNLVKTQKNCSVSY